jgi:opacity protein-like surface antigen
MRLKAFILVLLAVLFVVPDLSAEANKKRRKKKRRRGKKELAFEQGQKAFQPAVGFLVKTDYEKSEYGYYGSTEIKTGLPIVIRGEYNVLPFLSAGAFVGFYKEKVTITDNTNPHNVFGFDHKSTTFGIRSAYHHPIGAHIDPYAGFGLGLTKVKASAFGENNFVPPLDDGGFFYNIYGGVNYYFIKNVGVFAEFGYAKSWYPMISTGVSIKF